MKWVFFGPLVAAFGLAGTLSLIAAARHAWLKRWEGFRVSLFLAAICGLGAILMFDCAANGCSSDGDENIPRLR
jgi:hypothetical protein